MDSHRNVDAYINSKTLFLKIIEKINEMDSRGNVGTYAKF